MGPPASSPSVAPSWSNSDLVLHHLSVADQLQRQHVAKGGGEAPVATLFAALLDRTGLFSGERAVLQECYKLLSQQVQAAMYGEFASVPFPASFATQIFDRYFGAEPHRKAEFYKRVEAYVPVQGFANAERHVRDKASGALRRVSSSVGLGHLAAQIQGVQRSAFDDLTQRLDMATDEVRRLRDDLHACSDVPPAARKYSSEEVRDMHDLVARASLELQQYVSTCSEDPAFMRVWQELKAAASTQSTGATSAGPSQQGSPSGGGHQGDGAAASPSLSRDSPPPGLTAARPGADPTPAATTEQPAAAAASTPADPAGSEASDAEDGSSLSSSDERIERLRVLNGELRSNQSQLRAMKAAAEAWGEWHSAVERRNHIMQQLFMAEDRQMHLSGQLDRYGRQADPADGQIQGPAAAQGQIVWAFVNTDMGSHITPSLAVYYILRAVMEAAYLVKGKLSESEYRQMTQQPGQSLDAWGSRCIQLSKSYPHLDEDTHRTIFLHGIRDRVLQDRIRRLQTDSPVGVSWDLDTLVNTASNLANKEAALLQGEINSLQLDDKTRRERQHRLQELQYLLGGGGQLKRSSTQRAGEHDRGGDGGRTRDAKGDDREADLKAKLERAKRLMPKDKRGLQEWGRKPCLVHGKGTHTNAECQRQKREYANRLAMIIIESPTAMLAEIEAADTPRSVSSSSVVGLQPHAPSIQGTMYPYSAYDMPSASVVQTSTYRDDRSVLTAPAITIKEQRKQGLGGAGAAGGGRGPGRPPGRPVGGGSMVSNQGKIPMTRTNLPLPPPPRGPCESCGWQRGHSPWPCGYAYPHLACTSFRPPDSNPVKRQELLDMFQAARRKMPPNMQLGDCIPEWYELYKGSMSLTQRNMVEQDMERRQRASMAVEEYGYMATAYDGLGLDPAHVAYYAERERLGLVDSLFPNQPSCVVSAPPLPAPEPDHHCCSVQPAPSSTSSDPSCSSTKAQPPSEERAAAFPASFLQQQDPPTTQPEAGGVHPRKRKKQQQQKQQEQLDLPSLADQLEECINTAAKARDLVLRAITGSDKPVPLLQAAAAALQLPGARAKQGKQVSFVDELQQRQQQDFDSRIAAMIQELRDTMQQHGLNPDQANSLGLHELHQHLRGHRRFCLDTFTGQTPQTGLSVLTKGGKHAVVLAASVDSGATCIISGLDWVLAMGIGYCETPMQLRLANDTKGRVVGLTEPFWVILAAGTPYEARLLVQALVISGVGDVFQLLLAKDWSYRLNAVVHPREQVLVYDTAAGTRHSLPIEGHKEAATVRAALSDVYEALEKYEDELAPTAFACSALVMDAAVADPEQPEEAPLTPQVVSGAEPLAVAEAQPSDVAEPEAEAVSLPVCMDEEVVTDEVDNPFGPFWAGSPKPTATPRVYTAAEVLEFERYHDMLAHPPISVQLFVVDSPAGPQVELEVYYEEPVITEVEASVRVQPLELATEGHVIDCRQISGIIRAEGTSIDEDQFEEVECEDVFEMYKAYAAAVDYTHWGSLWFEVLETGGEPYVRLEIYYEQLNLDDFSHSTGGVASALAAAAGLSRESLPASPIPPDANDADTPMPKARTVDSVLQDIEWGRPHWYYRLFAYVAMWLLILTAAGTQFATALLGVFFPVSLAGAWLHAARTWWLNKWWRRFSDWVDAMAEPPPPFEEPKPFRTASRTRKQGRYPWGGEARHRLSKGKYLTSRLLRNARRCAEAKQQFDQFNHSQQQAMFTQQAVRIGVGCTFRGVLPLLLVLCVCLLASVTATPELLEGARVFTTSLAAWELSRLARWDFRPRSMLDDLLPEGKQYRQLKDSYTVDKEHLWSYGNHPQATAAELEQLKSVLLEHKHAFSYSMSDLPGYSGPPVTVEMVDDKPIISPPRRYSKLELEIQAEKCNELKDVSFIERADVHNKYASCPTMPAKKNEKGEWVERRFCIDYRLINAKTKTMRYHIDTPEALFDKVAGKPFLSSIDMRSGFHQLPLDPFAKSTTAFWWGKELWQYTRLAYGAKNSVYCFQSVMDTVLKNANLTHCAWAYVDDVLIASETMEQHIKDVAAVLQALYDAGLRVHPGKSVFGSDKMEYLGHVVTPDGVEPQAAKVAAIAALPTPTSVPTLQSFMGLLNYYRCYLPGFSLIAQPIHRLLQKGAAFDWGPEQQQAYDTLKQLLCQEGLALKRPDPARKFILHTDWSKTGIGAVLAQVDDKGQEYMVACASRSLNIHERNYTPWKGELLAVVWGIKTFRTYLHGAEFELVTDHRPLLWLLHQSEPTGQHARWVLSLMEYDFVVRHRPGVQHVNADVLSRYPESKSDDGTGAQLDQATDVVRAPLPKVVHGPVGTGVPQDVPLDQIPTELPPEQVQQRQPKGTKPPAPAPAPSPASPGPSAPRKKQTKAQFRNQHKDPYALGVGIDVGQYAAAISCMAIQVTAAQGKAAFVQRHLSCPDTSYMTSYSLCSVDPWELPYSSIPDPLAAVAVQPWAAEQQEALRHKASNWVRQATLPSPIPTYSRTPDMLNIDSVSATFFPAAQAGLVVYEPFGGLCSGLEAVLRNGLTVSTYLYSDIDPVARTVAEHRLRVLQARYPGQLPATALQHTFTALPQDVWQVSYEHLQAATSRFPSQWLVVGGWECQDLSPAGKSVGLSGSRSSTISALMQILNSLQLLQPQLPPGYIVENTAMQYNPAPVIQAEYKLICEALGPPTCMDAARFDSLAHRVRNFWTNLCTQWQLEAAMLQAERTPGLTVDSAIRPGSGRSAAPVTFTEKAHSGRYPVNRAGQPRSAWPTFVSYPNSRAFRPGQPGYMHDTGLGPTEPTAWEREKALGYHPGDTQAPGVSEQQRREVLGRCIDANCLQAIVAIAAAWHRRIHWRAGKPEVVVAAVEQVDGQGGSELPGSWEGPRVACCSAVEDIDAAAVHGLSVEEYLVGIAVCAVAESSEKDGQDIWEDKQTLHYLQHGDYEQGWTQQDKDRVRKRGLSYVYGTDGVLRRKLPDGSTRIVPKPERRQQLILEFHHRNGHYGVRRTGALISHSYWWWGLWADVAAELSKCSTCSRVRSSFHAQQPELQPLPISGLMYRWGVDLCGPFEATTRGNQYCLVAVEHYSKHLELVPIPNKEPATTAAAVAAAVLGRYGSPAELVTDRGGEWEKEFHQLLLDCMIDHRHTSASHPPANGLTERAVGTVKRALSKICADQHSQVEWDLHLPWLMLGYNASPQKSTGFAPYQLMHGINPVVPPAIREPLQQPFEFDDSEACAADFIRRSHLIKQRLIMAGENLKIAQHRDVLRYAKLRSGNYSPQLRRFIPGDYVYVKRKDKQGLDILAKQLILRVVEVRPSGVIVLQGRCGTKRAVHISQCAPCHLPNIDPSMDYSLRPGPAEAVCEHCGTDDVANHGQLIFCDNCNCAWHLQCHNPKLASQPKGSWVCCQCESQGITKDLVEQLQKQGDSIAAKQQEREKLTPHQLEARSKHGLYLRKQFTVSGPQGRNVVKWFWGKAYYRGQQPGGNLIIAYEDGDVEVTNLLKLRRAGAEWQPLDVVPPAGVHFMSAANAEAIITARMRDAQHTPARPQQRPAQPPQHRPNQGQGQASTSARAGPRTRARAQAQVTALSLHTAVPAQPVIAATSLCVTGVLPVGTPAVVSTKVLSLVSIAPSYSFQQLPKSWDLTKAAEVSNAMRMLMPGRLDPKDATRISNRIKVTLAQCEQGLLPGTNFIRTDPAEVQPLFAAVDFSSCQGFYDPFAGSGGIATALAAQGYAVVQNDLNTHWGHSTASDALQPGHYIRPPHVIITSPPFDVLDIAAPLAARYAGAVACIHVPGHWIGNPREARQHWLMQLASEGRLHIIMGLPRGDSHRRCAWVIIFSSAAKRQELLRVPSASISVTFAP